MTLRELLDESRDKLDDKTTPYLWSDVELLRYINRAIAKLCKGAYLIADSTTVAVCQVALTLLLGAHYTKHAKIILLRSAKLTGYNYPLAHLDETTLEERFPYWQAMNPGIPQVICDDLTSGKLTFIPAPDANYTANLVVYRLPLTDLVLETTTGSPEIHERYHEYILDGVLYQAYGKQDAETFDRNLELKYEVRFERNIQKAFRENFKDSYSSKTVSLHRGFIG